MEITKAIKNQKRERRKVFFREYIVATPGNRGSPSNAVSRNGDSPCGTTGTDSETTEKSGETESLEFGETPTPNEIINHNHTILFVNIRGLIPKSNRTTIAILKDTSELVKENSLP